MQRHESSRHFREYLKGKINELETNSKNRNIKDLYRGINEYGKCYQPTVTVIEEEKCLLLLAESHSIVNKWKNHFHQLFHMQGNNDVMQIEKLKDINHEVVITFQRI